MPLNQERLNELSAFLNNGGQIQQGAVGYSPKDFWNMITCEGNIQFVHFTIGISNPEPNWWTQKNDRATVIQIVANPDVPFIEKLIVIFAWGNMPVDNAIQYFAFIHNYREYLESILDINKRTNRTEIYRKIRELGMIHIGPPFYTKLIYFFMKARTNNNTHVGYIMDSVISKSVNYLNNKNIVHFSSGAVAQKNTPETYKIFCNSIEEIAKQLGLTPEETEILMLDKKHRSWRKIIND